MVLQENAHEKISKSVQRRVSTLAWSLELFTEYRMSKDTFHSLSGV